MGNNWTIEDSKPAKGEEYDWRLPANDQEHVAETSIPGDLRIKPEDIELKPTNSPKQSGIQHGLDTWTIESSVDSSWYVLGQVIQDD